MENVLGILGRNELCSTYGVESNLWIVTVYALGVKLVRVSFTYLKTISDCLQHAALKRFNDAFCLFQLSLPSKKDFPIVPSFRYLWNIMDCDIHVH